MEVPPNPLLLLKLATYTCLLIISSAVMTWVIFWITSSKPYNDPPYLDNLLDTHIRSRFFRTDAYYGSALIYQAIPFAIIALLTFPIIELRKTTKRMTASTTEGTPRANLSTYPCIIRSPLGVLTCTEVLGTVAVLFLVTYSFGRLTYLYLQQVNEESELLRYSTPASRLTKIAGASYYIGRSAMIPFSLLWIPVSRGSPFLRLINVPFEHAVKYHKWLATLTVFMLTLHGTGFFIYYLGTNRIKEMTEWRADGESCSAVAGTVGLMIGIVMWVTSMPCIRRKHYEIFFGVHHLYIVFAAFWLYHAVWTVHFIAIPCLLFLVDRFLRMVQSRHSVDVLSVRLLDSGCVQVRVAAQPGLKFHALSSWYLQFPSLSKLMSLQWHLFSVISITPNDPQELLIVIKPMGNWTRSLRHQLLMSSQILTQGYKPIGTHQCPFSFRARVEGPYGDESNFFLRYEILVLVGGGIGVAPLLAIIHDIMHKQGSELIPLQIRLYYCVRKLEELCILNDLTKYIENATDGAKPRVDLHVFAYVTSTCPNDYIYQNDTTTKKPVQSTVKVPFYKGDEILSPNLFIPSTSSLSSYKNPQGVCNISTKGSSIWVFSTMFASVVGFYACWGTTNIIVLKGYSSHLQNYDRANLIMASMIFGVVIFGGAIVSFWWLCMKFQESKKERLNVLIMNEADTESIECSDRKYQTKSYEYPWHENLQLHSRPCWRDIFNDLNKDLEGRNIGVLVSGPSSMQEDIARECKRHTRFYGSKAPRSNVFHYHSFRFNF